MWVMYINANPAITIENGYDYNLIGKYFDVFLHLIVV